MNNFSRNIFALIFTLSSLTLSACSTTNDDSDKLTHDGKVFTTEEKLVNENDEKTLKGVKLTLDVKSITLKYGFKGELYAQEVDDGNEYLVANLASNTPLNSSMNVYRYILDPKSVTMPYEVRFDIVNRNGEKEQGVLIVDSKEDKLVYSWHFHLK